MPKNTHKIAIAGAAILGAAALAFAVVPADAQTTTSEAALPANVAYRTDAKTGVTDQFSSTGSKIEAIAAQKKALADAVAKAAAAKKAAAEKAAAAKKAAADRAAKTAASRSTQRAEVKQIAVKTYSDNLDGWIRNALDIMENKGIPGSYNGLYRNIIRESSGNPWAINNWDSNAAMGIPSKGLLQVIQPTFTAYHVSGTSKNIYDPVANITAAANYAAHRYGSIDNVNSAY
ncbi:transglycosylase SLT domain-containing protein [Streptomyces acidiscabies]|uniref:Transglycosylase SLT domain-containing protein n=1 Tax=Streptomyces acidiscabies TaxID=42234 RepID=A0AAP6B6K1_9ACTN|nr:transglycosylase SLT domain-containing protein [Streptomyces acidiscabies]MBP5940505.1 transglycosylase SLT domain-containing protein [Streptomyces sp. LBUM 1476]MBZ3911747.1 transglycosylase SLT domain-containing protein [Streptomyces acidiscabies]MDX2958973.1 transglycosylase SLT domain-containing protein [Streptomyces acidiscabies]MDX3018410.1 transglycosylase SLT domain-containing protein [Streptomyces acidiscabies]MDX3794636.1 transglycosylase SLT domain-containing protein [Streptomyce